MATRQNLFFGARCVRLAKNLRLWLLLGCVNLMACTGQSAFRDRSAALDHAECGTTEALVEFRHDYLSEQNPRFNEQASRVVSPPQALADNVEPRRCLLQTHVNGNIRYDVAFLELDEAGELRKDAGGTPMNAPVAIENHLAQHRDWMVLTYVHGWRNDASLMSAEGEGDDIRRFHTLLALTTRYVQERWPQSTAGTTGSAPRVLGVFVGWRGAVIDEPRLGPLGTVLALPTILNRKPHSDRLAPRIAGHLQTLDQQIRTNGPAGSWRRHLVYGHSLGGNILVRGLNEPLQQALLAKPDGSTPANLGPLGQGLGDLVVLFNPASEAGQMHQLQRAARIAAGIAPVFADQHSYLDPAECSRFATPEKQAACAQGTHDHWLAGRAPLLISITASNHFGAIERVEPSPSKSKDPGVASSVDWATGMLFPWVTLLTSRSEIVSQESLARLQTTEAHMAQTEGHRHLALGHQLPIRRFAPSAQAQGKPRPDLSQPVFGISHEMEINMGFGKATSYALANTALLPKLCPAEDVYMAWQTAAVKDAIDKAKKESPQEDRHLLQAGGRGWDTKIALPGTLAPEKNDPQQVPHNKKTRDLELNIRHGAARQACSSNEILHKGGTQSDQKSLPVCRQLAAETIREPYDEHPVQIPTLGHAWEPIWNLAAHPSTVDAHGGYASHGLWCFLNRMVLDRP